MFLIEICRAAEETMEEGYGTAMKFNLIFNLIKIDNNRPKMSDIKIKNCQIPDVNIINKLVNNYFQATFWVLNLSIKYK